WAYLFRNWYTQNKWDQWARSNNQLVPNSKSTMLVEGHWRALKHSHLYHHNRPRLDLLCFIITDDYYTDLISSYRQKVLIRCVLHAWEDEYIKTWNNHFLRQHNVSRGNYNTNIAQWTCSCPQFYTSWFLLCKHIVRASNNGVIAPHQYLLNEIWSGHISKCLQ
ncbi:hypothetical protein BC941DRAFT_360098, partial [Chlamydoabsidia padenii]